MDNLSKLPAPPKGQTGISPELFSHLPAPPQGQVGIHPNDIGSIQSQPLSVKQPMPLSSSQSTNFGKNLLTSAKDVGTGLLKFGVGFTRDTAGSLQGLGQRLISGFSGQDLSQVQQNTGFKSLDNSTPEGASVANTLENKNRGEQIGGLLGLGATLAEPFSGGNAEKLIAKGKSAYSTLIAGREAKAGEEAVTKVSEMIAPKPINTQAKLAQSEGRLVKGKEPTLFKSGTPDTVIPSSKTQSATQTIIKNIPDAQKMTPPELYNAVDEHLTKTAEALRPQMEATPIKPETIQKINDDWGALKKTQMADAPATEEANVAKRQAKFESLLQKSGNENQSHLWDTRVAYDNSIPDAVKKASDISSESLQLQKQEWLQNRAIFNSAINDTENGMGATSQKSFAEMKDMYEAKTGLQSKAKIEVKTKPSKIIQFAKKHPYITSAITGETGRKIITGKF